MKVTTLLALALIMSIAASGGQPPRPVASYTRQPAQPTQNTWDDLPSPIR